MDINHPLVYIIAHPTGRLINDREGMDVNWMELFELVKEHNKILEINSFPERLDLPYDLLREAKNMGIKLIINTDAHQAKWLDYIKYGVSVARRGFCEPNDILNTLPREEFLKKLK